MGRMGRHESKHTHAHACADPHDHGHAHTQEDVHSRTEHVQASERAAVPADEARHVLRAKITGMDCGSCALTIEDGLRQLPGARRVAVDFTTEILEVEGDVATDAVERRLRQLGYGLATPEPIRTETPPERAGLLRFFLTQRHQRLAVLAGAACILAAIVARLAPATAAAPAARADRSEERRGGEEV